MKRKHLLLLTAVLTLAAFAAPVHSHETGQWILRAGVGVVDPKDDNLDVSEPPDTIIVDVDSGTSLTLTGTYMFTPNWALDILASWPFNHDIDLSINGVSQKVAETDHLPPTVSIQYHFLPEAQFQPYAGLGLNWTTFFNTDTVSELSSQGIELDLDDSFGIAAQLGADFLLSDRWLLNLDIRWIDIETDATFDAEDVGTVEIDPWVYSLNVGYTF